MKKASRHKVTLNDGDTLVLDSDQSDVLQKCCGCGLWHHIKITRCVDGRIAMTFSQLDQEPEVENPKTQIERA